MRGVRVSEQAPELGGQSGVTERDFAEEIHCLVVILAATPFAEAEPADRISRSDTSQDRKSGCDVGLPAFLCQD